MITVVIPAKNESEGIEKVIFEISNTFKKNELEIIVINDGSTDDTSLRAQNAGAIVLNNPNSLGYGASIKRGISSASYDMIATIDADLTYPSNYLPRLINLYQEGFDMVIGARQGRHYDESMFKKILRSFLRFMVEYTSGAKAPDVNSGMRVFSKKTSEKYFSHLCNTFSFSTSLTLAYYMSQKFVGYVDIPYEKRIGKSKVSLYKDALRTIQYILEITIFYNPLKIFILLSSFILVISSLSLLLGIYFKIKFFYFFFLIGVSTSIINIALGFLAVLLRQILIKE